MKKLAYLAPTAFFIPFSWAGIYGEIASALLLVSIMATWRGIDVPRRPSWGMACLVVNVVVSVVVLVAAGVHYEEGTTTLIIRHGTWFGGFVAYTQAVMLWLYGRVRTSERITPGAGWTQGRMVAWGALLLLALALTIRVGIVRLPPQHDESLLLGTFLLLLLVLAVPAAALLPRPNLNAGLFAGLAWAGYLAIWIRVATEYGYFLFAPQFFWSLLIPVGIFGVVWLLNAASWALWALCIRSRPRQRVAAPGTGRDCWPEPH